MAIPLKMVSFDSKVNVRGWKTSSGTYIAEFMNDSFYIVHGRCIGIDDDRSYFEPIEISGSDIKVEIGSEILNLDLAIVVVSSMLEVGIEA